MIRYFKLDSRKLTYREYWNIVHSWQVIIPWTAKLLNIPFRFMSGLPGFESLKELEVPLENFSPMAIQKLQPLMEKCESLGFSSPRFVSYQTMHREVVTSIVGMVHPSGAMVRLSHTISLKNHPPKQKVNVFLLSELRDGTFLGTSGQRQQFLTAPGIHINRLVGASPEKLIESHLQKLAELPVANPPRQVTPPEIHDEIWNRYEKRSRDYGMERGIYVWMSPEETATEHQTLADAKNLAAGNEQDLGVLVELSQIQNQKATWTGMLILFFVSLVLFIGFGAKQWSLDYLMILVGVVFVHELGHYVAMRLFNYKNVRMFFIPFFGAAVSGRHYNVPGWKKVVVSLMGPVPGILLGMLIGGVALLTHEPMLFRVALVFLALNGFNLIPVLPLDGGWSFHGLFFSRHYMLDIVFRALAALLLIASVFLLHTRILMYLGILALIGIPVAYREARIAADLKKRGFLPISDDDQSIPPATAQVIIAEVKKASTRPQSNKLVAQQTLHIFEMLNARPPGWSATIGLLFVQLASIAAAAVFAVIFIVFQNREFLNLLSGLSPTPKYPLVVDAGQAWSGNLSIHNAGDVIVVGTFSSSNRAQAVFQNLTRRLPATTSLRLFGESLLLSLPGNDWEAERKWHSEIAAGAKSSFLETTNHEATFAMSCMASDTNTANALVLELNNYLESLPERSLVPPWQPGDARSPEEKAQNELSRQTYIKLSEMDVEDDPAFSKLEDKLETAQETNDQVAVQSLQKQMQTLSEQLKKDQIEQLRLEPNIDTNVLDLFAALAASNVVTNEAAKDAIYNQLAGQMGQLPQANNTANIYSASSGFAASKGVEIDLTFISFNRLDEGPPALATWLNEKHCESFKYVFVPGLGGNRGGD